MMDSREKTKKVSITTNNTPKKSLIPKKAAKLK
jgi:hypothetical protein